MITSKSATLIDNIFTNSKTCQTSGIIITDISDHLPVFITTDLDVYKTKKGGSEIEVREFTNTNIEYFRRELNSVNLNSVCNSADANVSYSQFIQKFNELYDKCIPRIKKRVYPKRSKPKSPWISFVLLKSVDRKNKLYKRSIKKPTDTNIESYKKYRNKLNTLLRLAKRNYYCDLLDQEKNNIKHLKYKNLDLKTL